VTGRPNIIVQLPTREKVRAFRDGLGDTLGVVALEMEPKVFWTLGGLDALYLTLSRAERWGSRPLPPHTAALLRTTELNRFTLKRDHRNRATWPAIMPVRSAPDACP
jgi:hypothetical protein